MIINCIETGKTSRKGINKQEYQKHNKTMFQKKIITSTCSGVAMIMKNYWRHVREKKKNNDDKKVNTAHRRNAQNAMPKCALKGIDRWNVLNVNISWIGT